MTILLAFFISASVFSVNGIGEDLSVFRMPFLKAENIGQIGFTIDPEYTMLNQEGNFRGIFWTNPIKLSLSVPVVHGFTIMVGNCERFNQSYDVYLQDSSLDLHTVAEGGIEELYAGLNKNIGPIDVVFTGSYLFGNAREIWNHSISGYTVIDTFPYRYRGRIFNIALKHSLLSVGYEGFGRTRMIKLDEDTMMIDLPQRISVGVYPRIRDWLLGIIYEHSAWDESNYDSPHRFRVSAQRGVLAFGMSYNPWYIKDVTEYGVDIDYVIPLRKVGSAQLRMSFVMREKEGLREFKFAPKLTFVLNELFVRRRK
jgi:hypothetical protein